MSWKALMLFIAVAAGSTSAVAGEKSMLIDPQELRMQAFEKKIDFHRAMLNHVASEKIVFDWSNIEIPPHLRGWKMVGKDYIALDGNKAREIWEWAYTKDPHGVGIEVTSYKVGDQDAMLAIRNLANASSLAEPPFVKGPADLGTICLELSRKHSYTLHWAYRDLEFKLEASDKDTALKTAYWLQSIAEAHRQPR